MSDITLTKMSYGDIRLLSFLWAQWLLPGDSIIGTPVITVTEPLIAPEYISLAGSTVTCSVTAGTFSGTGQVSCEITTAFGEKGTRTAFIPVAPLTS